MSSTRPEGQAGRFDAMEARWLRLQDLYRDWLSTILSTIYRTMGIDGMTISEVRGHGRQKGHKEVYRGQEYSVDLLPKVKVEMVVPSERSEEIVQALSTAARTGKIGDGKIFIYDVAEAVRIRNGDRGDSAL